MWISSDDNSFNFVAPAGAANQKNELNFPYFEKEDIAAAATIDLDAKFGEDVKDLGVLTGNTTINAAVNSDLKDGAKLYLKMTDSGASGDTVTLGTGFSATSLSLTTDKTYLAQFILIGGSFYLISNSKQD